MGPEGPTSTVPGPACRFGGLSRIPGDPVVTSAPLIVTTRCRSVSCAGRTGRTRPVREPARTISARACRDRTACCVEDGRQREIARCDTARLPGTAGSRGLAQDDGGGRADVDRIEFITVICDCRKFDNGKHIFVVQPLKQTFQIRVVSFHSIAFQH